MIESRVDRDRGDNIGVSRPDGDCATGGCLALTRAIRRGRAGLLASSARNSHSAW